MCLGQQWCELPAGRTPVGREVEGDAALLLQIVSFVYMYRYTLTESTESPLFHKVNPAHLLLYNLFIDFSIIK